YLLTQTFIIYIFGSQSLIMMNSNLNYLLSIGVMVLFSLLFYRLLLKGEDNNIYFLLLIGMILGTFSSSFTSFMQVLIDPNEFMVVQDRMFASINNVNTNLEYLYVILILAVTLYFLRFLKYLDVLSLVRVISIILVFLYNKFVIQLLIIVVILISITNVLIGPITFLGLIVVNIAYLFLNTYKHVYIILGSVFLSIIALLGGQFIVEKVFVFETTISVIINFIGGIYFIYLLLKENKSW